MVLLLLIFIFIFIFRWFLLKNFFIVILVLEFDFFIIKGLLISFFKEIFFFLINGCWWDVIIMRGFFKKWWILILRFEGGLFKKYKLFKLFVKCFKICWWLLICREMEMFGYCWWNFFKSCGIKYLFVVIVVRCRLFFFKFWRLVIIFCNWFR